MPVQIVTIPSDIEWDEDEYDGVIKPHFPYTTERQFFKEIVALAYDAIKNGYENIFIEMGVGIGKTGVVKTLGEALMAQKVINDYYVLTSKIGLMEQYEQEKGVDLDSLKGRSNFNCLGMCDTCPEKKAGDLNRICLMTGVPCDADHAPCRSSRFDCPHRNSAKATYKRFIETGEKREVTSKCDYMKQYYTAAMSQRVLTNPAYLFKVQQGEWSIFPKRSLAFYDEAHSLPNVITEIAKKSITKRDWKDIYDNDNLPLDETPDTWRGILPEMAGIGMKELNKIQDAIKAEYSKIDSTGNKLPPNEAKLHELDKSERHMSELVEKLGFLRGEIESTPTKLKVEYSKRKNVPSMSFTPIIIAPIASYILGNASEKRVFLSASFRDAMFWVSTFGLQKQNTLFIMCEESPFPMENRRIYYMPAGSMSYKQKEKSMPKLFGIIEGIMEKHAGQHGIILPFSYQTGEAIYNGVKKGRERLIIHTPNKDDREEAIEKFLNGEKKDSTIISPYLNEGFDGKDDRARFLILCKVPYASMGDMMIQERIKYDQKFFMEKMGCTGSCGENGICQNFACGQGCMRWYKLTTALTLIQMAGRIVRHDKDWGAIYILDGSFKRFYMANLEFFPKYMRDAIDIPIE